MSYFRKKLERRTFSQDRYYILIKRQKAGNATFSELTELDEIVNRVPDIREKVIIENFFPEDESGSGPIPQDQSKENDPKSGEHKTVFDIIRSFFHKIIQRPALKGQYFPLY
ncbi:MAG TPA: hypothetical protein VHC47_09880 [Mucilaginibacter sp.]|nr:hypothetical protein [Mucilaginibacter sp.]